MKKRLITWEEFERKFKPEAIKWNEYINGTVFIEYKQYRWNVSHHMREYFGKEIEVRPISYRSKHYNYNDMKEGGWAWHELWFEPKFEEIEFLSMNDMEI